MDSHPENASVPSLEQSNDNLLNEAESLIWDLLDDEIQPAGLRRLETLLKENADVRDRYVSCVQTHIDLREHFSETPTAPEMEPPTKSPVLGFLGDIQPGTGTPVPE